MQWMEEKTTTAFQYAHINTYNDKIWAYSLYWGEAVWGEKKNSSILNAMVLAMVKRSEKKNALNRMHKSRKFIIIAIITSNTRAFAFIVHLITAKTMAKPTPHSQASCNKGSYCKRAVKRKPCQRSTEIDCYVVSKIENDLRHAHTYNGGV